MHAAAGAITGDIDFTQLVFAGFVIFFLGLVYYLRQQDKREGYPLEDPADPARRLVGFPLPPPPKEFLLPEGGTAVMPHFTSPTELKAARLFPHPGSPWVPTGDPLEDAVGPAAYPLRGDAPLYTSGTEVALKPMRDLPDWRVWAGEVDPRGMTVIGVDGVAAGTVIDLWVDRDVKILRYLEVELALPEAQHRVLLPIYYSNVRASRRQVRVKALRGAQFAKLPVLKQPNLITAREEDRLNAFFSGAYFYRYHQDAGF